MKHLKTQQQLNESSENLNISDVSDSYGMGKNILDKNCEYYGEESSFKVYNKIEDYIIQYDRTLSSTNILFKKGTDITLYENISSQYNNWEYALEMGYGDYSDEKILTQKQFLSYLKESFK